MAGEWVDFARGYSKEYQGWTWEDNLIPARIGGGVLDPAGGTYVGLAPVDPELPEVDDRCREHGKWRWQLVLQYLEDGGDGGE